MTMFSHVTNVTCVNLTLSHTWDLTLILVQCVTRPPANHPPTFLTLYTTAPDARGATTASNADVSGH